MNHQPITTTRWGIFFSLMAVTVFLLSDVSRAENGQNTFLGFDTQAKQVLSKMTLEEKIGQMCQAEHSYLKDPSDIEKYFLGSLLSGGGSGPKDKSRYTLKGVTDVLFGDHSPTGKLSFVWPRSVSQLPLNLGDSQHEPLFEFGHGLDFE